MKNRSLILSAERASQKKPEGRRNGTDGRTGPENRAFSRAHGLPVPSPNGCDGIHPQAASNGG